MRSKLVSLDFHCQQKLDMYVHMAQHSTLNVLEQWCCLLWLAVNMPL